jgi:glycerol-3-phosphate dehydrogenase (NAD(P)+)
MRLAILGNGGFGTAMAIAELAAGHDVTVWGHDAEYTAAIARTRRNPRYLPDDLEIPSAIRFTARGEECLRGAQAVLVAVPTQHLRAVASGLRAAFPASAPVVSLAKGLEEGTALRPSRVLEGVLGSGRRVLALSGPSHAEEVARGLPATVVLAGEDAAAREAMQAALSTPALRIYGNSDLLGVELCGALKNVMAIAAGIADGLELGDNAKAAILSRGIVEMARFGVAEGAERETFFGLAGVGDLAVTAFSRHGRNRAFGERIGRGETMAAILASTRKVAEGVWTSRVVRDRARAVGVDMPLCAAVCAVLFEGVGARSAVGALMLRDRKQEASD